MVMVLRIKVSGLKESTRALDRVLPNLQEHLRVAVTRRVARRSVARLKVPPRPNNNTDYPLAWKSERQRRYVMAKLRREDNLPYQRTGRLTNSWDVRYVGLKDGGAVEVVNPSGRIIDFVAGTNPFRQPMFPRWYTYQALLAVERDQLQKELVDYTTRRLRLERL